MNFTDPFAVLAPVSAAAADLVEIPANRHLLTEARHVPFLDKPDYTGTNRKVIQLGYGLFLGQRSISVGSSRSSTITLSQAPGVGHHKFILRFEPRTAILLLSAISDHDYAVQVSGVSGETTALARSSWPIMHTTHIYFGAERRYHFLLVLSDSYLTAPPPNEFRYYLETIGHGEPSLSDTSAVQFRRSGSSSTTLVGEYLVLADISQHDARDIQPCIDRRDGKLYAAKAVRRQYPDAPERGLSGASLHANIARIRDAIIGDPYLHFILDMPSGGSLAQISRSLAQSEVKAVANQCLAATAHLHAQGLIHLACTPENILVVKEHPITVQLVPVGVTPINGKLTVAEAEIAYAYAYAAPEVLRGSLHDTSDVYSIGIILLQLLGHRPDQFISTAATAGWSLRRCLGSIAKRGVLSIFGAAEKPTGQGVGSTYTSLITHMTEGDPQSRISATDALQHPWLASPQGLKRRASSEQRAADPKRRR